MSEIKLNQVGEVVKLKSHQRAHFSNTLSYCCHTNIKLAVGTEFANTSLASHAIKSQHPIFSLSVRKLSSVLTDSKQLNWSEKYLLTTAIMVNLGLIETIGADRCGLHMTVDQFNKYYEKFKSVIIPRIEFILEAKSLVLPKLRINKDNASSGSAIKEYIVLVNDALNEEMLRLEHSPSARREPLELDPLKAEYELQHMLKHYNEKQRYSKKLGKWAVNQLRSVEVSSDDIAVVNFCLNADEDKLRKDLLKSAIETVRLNLEFIDDSTRLYSSIVLRHLQYRLETLYVEEEELGFVMLEDDFETTKGTGSTYKVRTKITDDNPVNTKAVGAVNKLDVSNLSDPMAKMKARMAEYKKSKGTSK